MNIIIIKEIKRLLRALGNSLQGWKILLGTFPNIRYLTAFLVLTLYLGFSGRIEKIEAGLLLLALTVSMGLEILNTALEETLDRLIPRYDLKVKKIKDIGSAAVFLSLLVYFLLLVFFLCA